MCERIWATANDGTKIPISLVYQKGLKLNSAPILLYGYGSYGITIPDVFNPIRMSLIDRGFVYAVAHIRGSKYMGESWYENGKVLKKVNTFTDFIKIFYINLMTHLSKNESIFPNDLFYSSPTVGWYRKEPWINLCYLH
jgi:oligopeptidase B